MMKKKKAHIKYVIVLSLALVLFFLPACRYQPKNKKTPPWIPPPQDRPSGPAAEINEKLGRGINLGNALEAPAIGDWGIVLEAEYFSLIKEKGFSSVRIPIRWSAHARSGTPYTIDGNFFHDYVDWAIGEALKNDLYAIINFHHYEEIFVNPHGEWDRFLAMWEQVAERYKDYPDSLVFEILNEPHNELTAELWNELLAEALAVIRKTNPDRTVMIGTAEWGGVGGLSKLKLPDDDHLILTVHFYSPFQFTHQGADWTDGAYAWLGTTWDGSFFEKRILMDELYPVYYYSCANNIPVNIGEFGAYSKADMPSRALWTEFCARMFEDYGFSWHYWEFCSGFGIYDPKDEVFHEELVNALISDNTSVLELGDPPATGEEMLTNGDFSSGLTGWGYGAWHSPYQADFKVVNNELVVDVTTAGPKGWNIQLLQDNIPLAKDRRYLLSFEAWSDTPRSFSAGIGAVIGSNFPSYGGASVFVTPEKRWFYILGTAAETLTTGRVSFSFGNETGRVYLDNISLKKVVD
ncbi:MAG TPA: cellulase family glycosylhydrolase [Firmicutes bacterium]|jgi:endoglucanase|nr:cellulase family glycosylhydrolase [Bacillota bacterium]